MDRRLLAAAALLLTVSPLPVFAQASLVTDTQVGGGEKPLWEVGLFGGAAWLPDYPAASQGQFRALPLPYVIYRGDVLKIGDRGLVRAEADVGERWELDIGLSGSFDSDSEDNTARQGMPDLDLLLEAGPAVSYHVMPRSSPIQLDIGLEIRAVISAEFVGLAYEGISINPKLSVVHTDLLGDGSGTALYASLGPVWGYDGVNEYFYEVDRQYATASRPAYEAEEGYIGTRLNIGLSRTLNPRTRIFAGTQIGYYGGAANEDSPLFREDWTVGFGAGITWSFWQSEERAPTRD
ncbi:MAG: hypothetical protein RLY86_1672 [Pseudomonadota bacterium]